MVIDGSRKVRSSTGAAVVPVSAPTEAKIS